MRNDNIYVLLACLTFQVLLADSICLDMRFSSSFSCYSLSEIAEAVDELNLVIVNHSAF